MTTRKVSTNAISIKTTTVVKRTKKTKVEDEEINDDDDFEPKFKKTKTTIPKINAIKPKKVKKEEIGSPENSEKEDNNDEENDDDDFEPVPQKQVKISKEKSKSKPKKTFKSYVEEVEDSTWAQEYRSMQKNTKEDMKIGAHLSIAGGIEKVPAQAVEIGASAFALFTGSQRTWSRKLPSTEACKAFKEQCTKHNFLSKHILPHGSYLINLGSPEEDKLAKSRDLFLLEMQSCEMLGLSLYNFHPGSHRSMISEDQCLARIAESINIVHGKTKGVAAVLEVTAGAGDQVGQKFEHIKKIIEGVTDKTRVGVCLDTCHMYAAGYDISSEKGYMSVMAKFDEIVGLKYLKGMHINDSKSTLGSKADRHESIGKGQLGSEVFKRIMNDPHLKGIPMILETVGPYDEEIKLLFSMLNDDTKK